MSNITKNKVEGIINVVSYGYEEHPDIKMTSVFTKSQDVKENFLKSNRKAEINRIKEWFGNLHTADYRWIINLVTKADLWWDKYEEVENHYGQGDYHKCMEPVRQSKHVINLPYCALIKPYYGVCHCGVFGDIDKTIMRHRLIHELLNLIKEEK